MSHRLFVAIRLPEQVTDALVDTMEALEGARWQSEEQLHLTLRFIGEVERPVAEDIAQALSRIAFAPFPLALSGVGHFERKGHPHAIWAGVAPSRALGELQQRVEHACRAAGLEEERRRFIPHVTIARLNRASGDIAPWLARHAGLSPPPFEVRQITLVESQLTDKGSHYRDIARFPVHPGE